MCTVPTLYVTVLVVFFLFLQNMRCKQLVRIFFIRLVQQY